METSTLASFKKIFQDSKGHVLLLAVLSPTCGPCLRGAQLVQEIFEENRSEILQGTIIWTPMLVADSIDAAEGRETGFSDSRVKHYWDPDRILGRLPSKTLNLKASIAWDVYLVYPPDHPWDTELPPVPKFWMHQLDEEPALLLDPLRLKRTVQAMIEKDEHD